ncbi:MAG: protein-methionine-sulfoxide reductase catalytic subunit MsrP [Pseudomonadales bacterium]|jgi:sulfoxide reductase catalytic subunit YedY|nr:protein-methionine-sulfoxide reductase catalytic subunit MsrP [Pseudomonadales bacterium]
MSNIILPKSWNMAENEATPESVYMDRRSFIKGTSLVTLATAASFYGCTVNSTPHPNKPIELTANEKESYPAKRNKKYKLNRQMTEERIAASFNNFFEFSEIKSDPKYLAQRMETSPWEVEVSGLVNKPRTFNPDDFYKLMPVEERLYRFRCVEAWAMAVPWTGFPLKALIDLVEPKSSATHIAMTTFYKPFTAQGQLAFWRPWPYTEALTLEEAANELAFMALGIYGRPLPKQHGAPVRLVIPWKYGFKSIKSIVKIEVIDYRPPTFWNTVLPLEYSFEANVDPTIPHPRWPQAREKMIGTNAVRATRLYNGYGKYVAHLYT